MIVVPAFAEGEERQPKIIAALVAGVVAFAAEEMRQRIDARGGVKQHSGAQNESPNEELHAGDAERWRCILEPEAAKIKS